MFRSTGTPSRGAAGQAMVLMVGGLFAVIAMIALIVDGGNAWAQQRVVQNGSDATAEAGAIVMAQRFAGVTTPAGGWDAKVSSKIQASAAANGLDAPVVAYYTDICGIPLRADGSAALNADGTENLAAAAAVGSGLPTSSATTPNCPHLTVGPPAGVLVIGHKDVQTYFAGAIGMSKLGVATTATAVSGYLQGYCDATQGQACAVLPVTIPVNIVSCDGSNNPLNTGNPWLWGHVYKVPLCQNGPGNVGWIDWTPTAGGTSELIDSIHISDNPAINLPSWQYLTETGNVNSQGVEDAIRTYDGQTVMIPQFDATCNPGNGVTPDSTQPAINNPDPPVYLGCGVPLGGNGSNQWYRMPSFAFFQFCTGSDSGCTDVGASHGAYVNGNDGAVCDTGNGATSCLVGRFVNILATGTVGPGVGGGTGSTKVIGVQLIK